eukprot:180208_1
MDFIPKKKCTDIRSCGDFFIYLKQNPRTLCASLTFFASLLSVLCLGMAYVLKISREGSFWTAGAAGIVVCLYGFCHFRTLMNLKKEVDDYSSNNKKFSQENHALTAEVNRFSKAKDELAVTETRIRSAIERQKVSLGKFRELNVNLEATGKKNLELLGDLNKMADKMETKWKEELIKKERKILHVCFDRFDWKKGTDGISADQFTAFKQTLPMEYQYRLTRAGSWGTIAGDDGILQLEEFIEVLDNFAEKQVEDAHKKRMSMASGDLAKIAKEATLNNVDEDEDEDEQKTN